jgi:hypothetical protein
MRQPSGFGDGTGGFHMQVVGRKIFYGIVKGKIVFHDWVVTNTLEGDLIEPLQMVNYFKSDGSGFDPEDEDDKVTELVQINFDKLSNTCPFGEGGQCFHSGSEPRFSY